MTNTVTMKELSLVFLKLGIFGFGGPAAHIAMMREEVVERRNWLSKDEFFDLVGATNLIPGPNSTELAIHVGYKKKGYRGLVVAGLCFILPAFFAVISLAFLYVEYGTLPALEPMLNGMRPVIVAIIILALMKFRESAVRNSKEFLIFLTALAAAIAGWNELLIILLAGLLMTAMTSFKKSLSISPVLVLGTAAQFPVSTGSIFLFFLKIGSVLFGSGYVLLAFLKNELVDEKMWLTSTQLIDAITVGQVTPGPVFTTATFVGYLLKGFEGATAATVGIFLPAFIFVAISAPFLAKLRTSKSLSAFLDGVNAASFSLMLLVTFELGQKGLFNIPTILLGITAFLILRFTKLNSAWPILIGGIIGYNFF